MFLDMILGVVKRVRKCKIQSFEFSHVLLAKYGLVTQTYREHLAMARYPEQSFIPQKANTAN
jgi:hypothetical protein